MSVNLTDLGRLTAADWDKIITGAGELMGSGKFGCSESIMLAYQQVWGQENVPPAVVAASSAFRGGMGGGGCVCGALAAGQMALGLVFGYWGEADGDQDIEAAAKARDLYKEMHDRFRQMHSATCCRVLTKNLDHNSPQRKEKCLNLVKAAAGLSGGIIAREASAAVLAC